MNELYNRLKNTESTENLYSHIYNINILVLKMLLINFVLIETDKSYQKLRAFIQTSIILVKNKFNDKTEMIDNQ